MKNGKFIKAFCFIASSVFILSIFILPRISFADVTPCETSGKICNPINVDSINGLIKVILEGVITIGVPIIAFFIIYSGFLFVIARGNPTELKKAKDALLYTVIGAAVLMGAWALAQLISDTVLSI